VSGTKSQSRTKSSSLGEGHTFLLRQAGHRGFTLIELLTVVGIMFIVAAIGVPKLITAVHVSRVRSGADAVLSVVQQARIAAQRTNTTVNVYTGAVAGGGSGGFADTTGSGSSFHAGDVYATFPANVTTGSYSTAPGNLSSAIGFTPSTSATLGFNSLGMESGSVGVVFCLTDPYGDWAAVAVSPLGRSKVWIWTGAKWQ
jgi:prepilin-type N-terminal cleavage/methylation domain-containing protein